MNSLSETILLVEDEVTVRLLARTILERAGFRILEASNGESALECWRAHQPSVDLLLTDMVMPGALSGRELAAQLQQDRPDLKVVFCSGYSEETLGQDFSARYFLQKPYTPSKLLDMVRDCLSGRSAEPV